MRVSLPLRTAIGFAFSLILLLSAGSLIWLNHRATLHFLQERADDQFNALVAQIKANISQQFLGADAVLDTLAITAPPTADAEFLGVTLARNLANLVETAPAALSLLSADGAGHYVLVDNLASPRFESGYAIRIGVPAPAGSEERVLRADGRFNVVHRGLPTIVKYDARLRPWYTLAQASPKAVTTPLYLFRNGNDYGFTLSRRAQDDAFRVFGIDIRLDSLSSSLRKVLAIPGEHVALFTPDGALLGDSDDLKVASLTDAIQPLDAHDLDVWRIDTALYAAYRQGRPSRNVLVTVDGRALYASLAEISVNGTTMVVASTVRAELFDKPATQLLVWSLLIQAAIVVLAFSLVTLATRTIAQPIIALAADVEQIIQFRPRPRPRSAGRIREVQRVSSAVDTLDLTLQTFSTYLPQAFVRTIVSGGRAPGLGGERQRLVVMFSDIDGFTALSEGMLPDKLLGQLSRYFQVITEEVLSSGGTLDKFIGDSVMAFWPLSEDGTDQVGSICRAVLRAGRRIDALNLRFAAQGSPVFNTRFGMNAGEALVGSVGTPDRLNYTVLGHVVNVAARIEQLNKDFDTRILVSGALRNAAGSRLMFRHVTAMPVRGTQEPIDLFELLEEGPDGE